MIHCMGCHLADGSGQPPDVPAFNDQLAGFTTSEAGRAYLVQVPGAAQSLIDDNELAAVINWVLQEYSEAGLTSDYEPFTGAEVARHRLQILSDPVSARAALISRQ